MSAILNTLPGDIPGLLRHGSPVLWADEPCLVQCARDGTYLRVDGDIGGTPDAVELKLDLDVETGISHAARWVSKRIQPDDLAPALEALVCDALAYEELTPTQIDTLARIVLRLAGRTP